VARAAARHGKGVCAGIAQYLDVPVKLVRLITVLAMIFWPVFLCGGGVHHPDIRSGPDAGKWLVRRENADQR
jgi:phage shock protein C